MASACGKHAQHHAVNTSPLTRSHCSMPLKSHWTCRTCCASPSSSILPFFLSSLWLASISLIFDTLEDLLQYTVFWLLDPFAIPYKEKTQRLRTRAAVLIELKLIQCNRPLIQTSLIHTSCCSGIERQHTSQEFPSNLILFDFAFTFQVCCIIMILVLINVEKSDLDL